MVPAVEVVLSGLGNEHLYEVILELVQITNDKYTVNNGEWIVKKNAAQPFNRFRGNLIIDYCGASHSVIHTYFCLKVKGYFESQNLTF